jgi:predicted nucleic acid-binding protein
VAIGLDTSVVLRLLIGEPRLQMEVARRRIERALVAGEKVVVTDLVVAEAFHALRHHYGVPETVALDRLIVARHRALGATTATFDRRQARLEGGVLLRA